MTTALARQDETSPEQTAPTAMRRILIMANPTAGGYNLPALQRICSRLRTAGHDVELRHTSRAGEIGDTCASGELDVDILAIAGGDGSINEAVAGLQGIESRPALVVIPSGTANVLAQELSLPRQPDAIGDAILGNHRQPLHYGLANGRPFVLMVSAGFDAEVVHGVPLKLKRRLGKLAYVLTALRLAFTRQSHPLHLKLDTGEELTCKLAVATNGRCYGGPFVICPDASVTTRGLHLLALEKDTPPTALRFGIALLLGRVHKARGVRVLPFERLLITSADIGCAAQVDGDPFGSTPIEIECPSEHVEIIVP